MEDSKYATRRAILEQNSSQTRLSCSDDMVYSININNTMRSNGKFSKRVDFRYSDHTHTHTHTQVNM